MHTLTTVLRETTHKGTGTVVNHRPQEDLALCDVLRDGVADDPVLGPGGEVGEGEGVLLPAGIVHAGEVQPELLPESPELCLCEDRGGRVWGPQSQYLVLRTEGGSELLVTPTFVSHPTVSTVTVAQTVLPEVQPLPEGLRTTDPVLEDVPTDSVVHDSVLVIALGVRVTSVVSNLGPYHPLSHITALVTIVWEHDDLVDIDAFEKVDGLGHGNEHGGPGKEEEAECEQHDWSLFTGLTISHQISASHRGELSLDNGQT